MESLQTITEWFDAALGTGGGLISGDTRAPVQRVLLASELNAGSVAEAIDAHADVLLTMLTPAATLVGSAGEDLRALIGADIALYGAGAGMGPVVADAIGRALGLSGTAPLRALDTLEYALLVVYTPQEHSEAVRLALAGAGAGAIGDYTGCGWSVTGTGEFTPGAGAVPTIGQVGTHEQVSERRLEMVVPLPLIPTVTHALRKSHPYEEPAFSFLATHPAPSRTGRGVLGTLGEPLTASGIAALLLPELPAASARYSGDGSTYTTVAILTDCSEQDVAEISRAGADVLITSEVSTGVHDLAYERGLGLIDLPRPAMAWAALPVLARRIGHDYDGEIDTIVSMATGPVWRNLGP